MLRHANLCEPGRANIQRAVRARPTWANVNVISPRSGEATRNTADGARTVPREHLEVANSFRSRRLRTIIEVVLPASTPYMLAGLRLAAGRALIGAVVAEFFLAVGGLGYYILYNSRTFHHNEAFVGVLLLAGFGVGFELVVNSSTRRFLPWYRREGTD